MPQNGSSRFLEDFRQGLRELGYVEGKNVELEIRFAEGSWIGCRRWPMNSFA
ncbi:MAG TPA: hypothetical protein VGH59_05810 [Casimicrobiaceae bacterium]|jgi:hypothetical protein